MRGHGPIVVGYDGSESSRDALALTRALAPILDANVIVLSVITHVPTEATWAQYERDLRAAEKRLAAEAQAELEGISHVETETVPAPSPPRELHRLAEGRGAELIVLGSTHRGRLGRVLPGTVADRLLAAAPCPIAVAPQGYAGGEHSFESIAIGYDGSEESRLALDLAIDLATAVGARLMLIAVASPHDALIAVPAAGGWGGMVTTAEGVERERQRVQAAVDSARGSIPAAIDTIAEVVVDDDPSSVIVKATEAADALLIGSRGYGPLGRVLLGGVSSRVLREAACPVLVTPRSSVGSGRRDSDA